jgi:glycosyltransferase involved in cell wall biosynthesis
VKPDDASQPENEMAPGRQPPIRVLHVLSGLDRGGTETWLWQVARRMDRSRFQMDYMLRVAPEHVPTQAYTESFRALGGTIITCCHSRRPWHYGAMFRHALDAHGPYDLIHSHIRHFSGYILRLAYQEGIPVRIAHIHSDTSHLRRTASPVRWLYLQLMQYWTRTYATAGLAVSRRAANSTFGASWEQDPRWRVCPCGIDVQPFHTPVDAHAVRRELGLPGQALVVGHVGNFSPEKNHTFLIDVAHEVIRQRPETFFLLVGDGPLRPSMEQQVARLGLAHRVLFAGSRADVPRLMMGAMDMLVFPSLFEGLGLVLIEAQAAGLPCVISDVVPEEATVFPPLVRSLSLSEPAAAWARVVLETMPRQQEWADTSLSTRNRLTTLTSSPFNIQQSVETLASLYEEAHQLHLSGRPCTT